MRDIDQDPLNDQFEIIRNDPENPAPMSVVLGGLIGLFAAVYVYLNIYQDFSTAILIWSIVCIVTTIILRLIGKYFWALCLVSYVIYVISNL